jgi:hypothetical protein
LSVYSFFTVQHNGMHNIKKNNYFIRIHTRLLFGNDLYYYQYNIIHIEKYTETETPPTIKVTNAIFSFVAYRFRNRKVRWWLNVSSWQHRMCLEVPLSQSSLLLVAVAPPTTASDWNGKCSERRNRCKDLLGKISFKLHKINSDYSILTWNVSPPNTVTVDDRVWLLMILT